MIETIWRDATSLWGNTTLKKQKFQLFITPKESKIYGREFTQIT